MEDWVTIKHLRIKKPTMSLREIGEILSISHHTVKSALLRESPPERAVKENEKLAPLKEVIFEMANVKHFRGSRIFEEIKSKGYSGGKTAFYAYLERIRIESQKHYTPYETAPGEQSQFDWSPYTVLFSGVLTEVVAFSYINAFSRTQIFDGSLSDTQGSVFEAMENGFIESGGVPERVQTDNAKVFVQNASKNNFQWNGRYLQFCAHYGFEPTRSLPGHPWSKGKVEKPFQYLEDHFIAGGEFVDFEDFRKKLKAFQHRVATTVHSTTKVTPEELLVKDRAAFSPLPETRYVGIKEEIRKVTFDCLLSFGGSRYSVPWYFAGKEVWVKVSRGYCLEVYSQANKLVARHVLATVKGSVVMEKAHYRTTSDRTGSFECLRELFSEAFPGNELFVEKLQAQKRTNAKTHLYQVLELAKLYQKEDMMKAIKLCMEYNVFNASFISGYLEKNFRQTVTLPREPLHYHITREPVTRPLSEYKLPEQPQGDTVHGTDTDRELPEDALTAQDQGDLRAGGGERSEHEALLPGLPAPAAGAAGALEDRAVGQREDAAGMLPASEAIGGI